MNAPFLKYTGIAAPLMVDNIDTDQIIPSREMKSVSKTGLSGGLFAGQRYVSGRTVNPDFVLNKAEFKDATILLSGKNFGCGSSREHAVWALKEYGFRAIIAESFGEIFYNNCVRNGILPIQLSNDQITKLGRDVTIDLSSQTVGNFHFDIPEGDKAMLIGGLDPIAMTLSHKADIDQHFARDSQQRPWLY
ncbi:3-isopropylmalate dehydratase small subunit [Fretibacter rubidus]|uniref:3-isopropylmalate dehydratase small subunit n=1 Tax=Fretibacter rubidus TaxID=570162 RepID=UPI00352AFE6C